MTCDYSAEREESRSVTPNYSVLHSVLTVCHPSPSQPRPGRQEQRGACTTGLYLHRLMVAHGDGFFQIAQ